MKIKFNIVDRGGFYNIGAYPSYKGIYYSVSKVINEKLYDGECGGEMKKFPEILNTYIRRMNNI